MADSKDKENTVEVEKKKPSRARSKADAPAETKSDTKAGATATEARSTQRRTGKVTGIADVSAALKSTRPVTAPAAVSDAKNAPKSHIDALGRAHATGRRKESTARVLLKRGAGRIIINGRPQEQYFARPVLRMIISQPFAVAERLGQYDLQVTVVGGGLSGQAGAVRHGLSRALVYMEPELRTVLKKMGFLTRDSRVIERKKPGQPKARRRFQFSKR